MVRLASQTGGARDHAERSVQPRDLWPDSEHVDDMHDVLPPATMSSPLRAALEVCNQEIAPAFQHADERAISLQRRHHGIVLVAASLGTLAVVMAILGLAERLWPDNVQKVLPQFEVVAALLALVAVLLGVFLALQRGWLLQRYRAEQLRALKFTYLVEPQAWGADPAVDRARLRQEVQRIKAATPKELKTWTEDPSGPPSRAWAGGGQPPDDLAALVDHYRLKRLGKQGWYYFNRANENEGVEVLTGRIPRWAFYASILAALAHFASEPLHDPVFSTGLVVVAAVLPVLGSAVRTVRGSREFARNSMRYRANYEALVHLDGRLHTMASPELILDELRYAERTLENESREWLRLMREAEWYA
jgi:hypothetical protein